MVYLSREPLLLRVRHSQFQKVHSQGVDEVIVESRVPARPCVLADPEVRVGPRRGSANGLVQEVEEEAVGEF